MNDPVRLETRGRIGLVVIDSPPINALSQSLRAGLQARFRELAAMDDVDAAVLACEGNTFVAGADLRELDEGVEEPGYHEVFNAIEAYEKPLIAAIHGTALGGGVELALACHYRVADARARLGFPEINLGIVPGAGGTQRLPRLIGLAPAISMFLSGRPISAAEARESGLVDAVVEGGLTDEALAFASRLAAEGKGPRRTRDMKLPSSAEAAEILEAERARVAEAMPEREIPLMDLDAVRAAVELPFEEGLAREREISDNSLETLESRALRRLFFAERKSSKVPGVDPDDARSIESGAIIGGGTMGRGIAIAFANAGLPVTVVEVTPEAADETMAAIRREYAGRVEKGKMDPAVADERLGRIQTTTEYPHIADADVVIEAVFESMALKKEIFARLDDTMKSGALLATNTSTLDIAEIAGATGRPRDVAGLHFFSPAQVMRLLEVVRSEETSDAVIATCMRLAGRLKKTGVLSANAYGFIGNRMMDPYGREAERMLLEGATPAQIDSVLERFGMAMGILAVFDMAGVDVGVRIREERKAYLPDDPAFYRSSALLVERDWLGQKSGIGFYRYERGSRARLENEEAQALFREEAERLGISQRNIPDGEIEARCILALINEGAKVLEEKVALRASDVDVVYTSGYGFPRHKGGPMFYADTIGLARVVQQIDEFRDRLDARYWEASDLLRRLAADGGRLSEYKNA